MEVTRIFEFDCAHRLPWHKGKCFNLHGHTYKLEVTASGSLNKNGIVIDFGDLKKIVNEEVVEKFDHHLLNDFYENPTAEIMAKDIFKKIQDKLPKDVNLKEVKLWESPDSYATYQGD